VADGAGGVAARDRRVISKLGFRIERERERGHGGEERDIESMGSKEHRGIARFEGGLD